MHKSRRHNAITGFLDHSFTKTVKKYLSVLDKNDKLTTKQFSNILKMRHDSLLNTLKKERYSYFMDIKGKGIRGNPFIFSITPEGRYLMDLITKMEAARIGTTV